MGKTTLYHPVSLHVIRGAAEYCGWKFKHIKQTSAEPDRGKAQYVAQVEIMPKRVWAKPIKAMQDDLQECFLDDIRIHWLRQSRTGVYYVDIHIDLNDTKPRTGNQLTVEQWHELQEGRNE